MDEGKEGPEVGICNGTLHSGGLCPIMKVAAKGGDGEMLGVQ